MLRSIRHWNSITSDNSTTIKVEAGQKISLSTFSESNETWVWRVDNSTVEVAEGVKNSGITTSFETEGKHRVSAKSKGGTVKWIIVVNPPPSSCQVPSVPSGISIL